jgi:hypothetical protein
MTPIDSGLSGMPRRHVLRMGVAALAGATVLGSRRPAAAATVCAPTSPARQCDWPSTAPTTDLGKLGKAIIIDNNQYNGGSSVKQAAYWDEAFQWSRKVTGGWEFKKQTVGVDRAIRIQYVGAKDLSEGVVADEQLLIGLDLQAGDRDGAPQGAVQFMTDTTAEPTNAYEKLAWLVLRVTSPKDVTAWSAAPNWDKTVALDKNGAEWPFRARRINVEASIMFKLFVMQGSNLMRARLLVGYEGSGGW